MARDEDGCDVGGWHWGRGVSGAASRTTTPTPKRHSRRRQAGQRYFDGDESAVVLLLLLEEEAVVLLQSAGTRAQTCVDPCHPARRVVRLGRKRVGCYRLTRRTVERGARANGPCHLGTAAAAVVASPTLDPQNPMVPKAPGIVWYRLKGLHTNEVAPLYQLLTDFQSLQHC